MTNCNTPLVSIIVPVYNVEAYLERCLDSIINQSYINIELIIVDDGSTDRSPEIIKKYTDSAIIISQKNKGLASARNSGLKQAHGEYICFVDSDDYLFEDAISTLVYNIERYNTDMVCALAATQDVKGKIFPVIKEFNIQVLRDKNDIIISSLLVKNIKCSVWAKLFRAKVLLENNCYFPEGQINEDNIFTCELASYQSAVSFVNIPIYYIEQRAASISRNYKDINVTTCYGNYQKLIRFYTCRDLGNYLPYINCNYILNTLFTLISIAYHSKDYLSFYHFYTLLDSSYFKKDISSCLKIKGNSYYIIYSISKHPRFFYTAIKCARLCGYKRYN